MSKAVVLMILLVLSGCMGSHANMGHGSGESSGGSHQH
jgi:hypothetical protein